MNLQQILIILRARYRVAMLTLIGTVALTMLISFMLPNTYTATTNVVVDVKSPDPIAGMVLPALAMPGYMATQEDIINSDRVAQKVVKLLKLDQSPQIRQQWMDETEGKGRIEVWLASSLQKRLEVKPSRESNVITISYKASDPGFSATLANAFAEAYIQTNIELKTDPARQYAEYFEGQNKTLRDNVEKAAAKLTEYQQEHGILAPDERMIDYEAQKLNDLEQQLVAAETQSAESHSKEKGGSSDTLQDVLMNPVVQALKNQIAQEDAKLQQLAGNVGRNHPDYVRQAAVVDSLKQQLVTETRRINTGVGTESRVNTAKVAELKADIEEHKQHLLELSKQRDEIQVLQREVDNAQKAYEAVFQRYSQANLESQASQTNIAVLTPAAEPTDPSSPKKALNFFLSLFLGGLLGMGAALVLEAMDRRIRSAADLEALLELPVLAELGRPEKSRGGWWRRLRLPGAKPPRLAHA